MTVPLPPAVLACNALPRKAPKAAAARTTAGHRSSRLLFESLLHGFTTRCTQQRDMLRSSLAETPRHHPALISAATQKSDDSGSITNTSPSLLQHSTRLLSKRSPPDRCWQEFGSSAESHKGPVIGRGLTQAGSNWVRKLATMHHAVTRRTFSLGICLETLQTGKDRSDCPSWSRSVIQSVHRGTAAGRARAASASRF